MFSFLPLVERCDNFRRVDEGSEVDNPIPFYVTPPQGVEVRIGWIRSPVVDVLQQKTGNPVFDVTGTEALIVNFDIVESSECLHVPGREVRFVRNLDSPRKRSDALDVLCREWRNSGLFSDVIGGSLWRDELYPIYYDPFKRTGSDNTDIAFLLERACCTIFGLVTYGCHMTMYLEGEQKIWVPIRAKTKTWPGCPDNTVAGGIPYGLTPTDALVKECMEEASLEESFVRKYLRATGAISYFFQSSKGWLKPKTQYVYDLVVPVGVDAPELKPLDGEVERFELLSVDDVLDKLRKGLFPPTCALVFIDFFIRHGHITPESEPNFVEILTRMHGRFGFDNYVCAQHPQLCFHPFGDTYFHKAVSE
ncbi:NUDIX hydrolase domain-like protein [Cantharellus anzutake]|uniref:NUDIX hydrolase domain-like protein n=1 Tax=Cantharellus anzutake TaxID=1750568 RepID=UPI00190824FA|nr:NUDIX hydrolase domain-like protein [Cantharellus anzutake]XP_038913258.1 NUDIX hydrolase domain-like protein [Cantharellus anzutake]KAF8321469.1 NUDIX hydrolase domain-like protein [Cantharellus anzutake]KAF8326994.1 NUDIX hydrolase domain-like protein [Cantharellus anzutake]